MLTIVRFALAVPALALLVACSTPVPTPPPPPLPPPAALLSGPGAQAACEALKGLRIEAARIVWPGLTTGAATVDSASWLAATPLAVAERGPTPAATITPALPQHCQVKGSIAPVDPAAEPIQFQVNLPADWNGRSVQFGGGGFNGVLIDGRSLVPAAPFDQPGPLAQGYVTVGTDSGHQNKPGVSPMAFALNAEMLANFAHAAYPKVRNVALALMQQAYGRAPAKQYFVGSSEGGREGLTMAQRYPAAFDGIFSRVPVINWTGLQFAGVRNGAATFDGGWMNAAQVKLVHDAQLAACDTLDGLADKVIANIEACRQAFNPSKLLCTSGAAPDTCLAPAQVRAIQTLRSPYTLPFALANGVTVYPGGSLGGEDTLAYGPTGGWRAWWVGSAPPQVPPVPANGIGWVYGAGAVQFFYAGNAHTDPREITPQNTAARVREISALMDSTNPDLSAFAARGGKLIVLENMADYAQSPYAGIQYVQTVRSSMGDRTPGFLRLYTAPGVDHVGTGAPALVNMLGALSNWVEKGQAPTDLQLAEQNAKPPFAVQRTRPLCEWPLWPRYAGGDPNLAASFACTP
jgi:Tannase and feruloyl esterase